MKDSPTRERQDQLGKRILIIVGLVAMGLIATKLVLDLRRPELVENLCPKDGPLKEVVVLVDRTDPFTETQRKFVTQWISTVGQRLNQYERLSLYGLSSDESSWNAEPIFSQCSPGSQANELYQTKSKVRSAYLKSFEGPLNIALSEILTNAVHSSSPIMEMVFSISRRPELSGRVPERHFVIVSDMMQNSKDYTQYKLPIDYREFAKSPFSRTHNFGLERAAISILYLERQSLQNYQNSAHVEFWERWFSDKGARIVEVVSIR